MYKGKTIWTASMESFLQEHYRCMQNKKLASQLCVSEGSVRKKLRELGLKKKPVTKQKVAAETVIRLFLDHSYAEIAELTGISPRTVSRIVKTYGLSRSKEQGQQIRSRTRKAIIKKEKARVLFGLPQRTRIKVVGNPRRVHLKSILKKFGYVVLPSDNTLYYHDGIKRRRIREAHGQRMGLRFQPLCAQNPSSTNYI